MTKSYASNPHTSVAPQHRSVRRFIRKLFACFLKRQACDCQTEFQMTVLEKLQDIGDTIEIIAREMARQAKRAE